MPLRTKKTIAALLVVPLLYPAAFGQCGNDEDCLVVHETPGCSDVDCCELVCGVDPLCCSSAWDVNCVATANDLCSGLCGAEASGDCGVPHPNPGCDDRDCCETVCGIDPFCCEVSWDFTCTLLASLNCPPDQPGTCGDPAAGPCTKAHSEPACDDQACCELVCAVDPTCCSQSWDLICVALATQYCVEACEPECPAGAVNEDEDCGQDVNNPCYGTPSPFPAVQELPCGTWACGQIASSPGGFRDIDLWAVSVVDVDGDGLVPVRVQLSSSFDGFAALVPAPCGPIAKTVAKVETDFCVELSSETVCVSPGQYRLVVAAGAFPEPGNPDLPCGQFGSTRYRVRVECLSSGCGPACGPGAGSCFEPRKLPGCEDTTCCDAVCARDPACCDIQWDNDCVLAAEDLCADPPANDECDAATEITGDSIDVVTIGATASDPPFPASCGGSEVGGDLWYRVRATRTATCTVTTCGSGTIDAAVAVYGSCGSEPIACNDDAPQCIPQTAARVVFPATCGTDYLVRVGSIGSLPGTVTVQVSYGTGPGCACPADLDRNGSVGGSDLTILLSAWNGPVGDLDGDGTTSGADLTILLSSWGPCP